MFALDLPLRHGRDVLSVIRALGAHRYVKSRRHDVHAFVVLAARIEDATFAPLRTWAETIVQRSDGDIASRDPLLWHPVTEAELASLLGAFWDGSLKSEEARSRLVHWLERAELPLPSGEPFDESQEEDIHPLLIDAGWELLSLAELDVERHRGVIGAIGEGEAFAIARFEEETAIPPPVYLHELSAIGPTELLRGVDDAGNLHPNFAVWAEGPVAYHDYLARGIARAAKLQEGDSA